MTIEQLIKELQQYDPKLPVILQGYGGGVYQATGTRKVMLALNVNSEWYYGPHELVHQHDTDNLYPGHERIQGVYLR